MAIKLLRRNTLNQLNSHFEQLFVINDPKDNRDSSRMDYTRILNKFFVIVYLHGVTELRSVSKSNHYRLGAHYNN